MRSLIILVLVVVACADPAPSTTDGQGQVGAVVAVLDGDSLRIDVGAGPEDVRLVGINAPEAGECWADESRDALVSLAGEAVTAVGDEKDQFGRRLVTVTTGDVDINLEMVRRGEAIAQSRGGRPVLAAEAEAFAARRGLWGPTACGPHLGRGLVIEEVASDPPGDDAADLAGEYVVVANEGPRVDLTGWVLRDESSAHRFRFPDGFSLDPNQTVMIRTGCTGGSDEDLHWCADGPVWNNGGDMALLLDPSGNVVARFRY